MNAAVPDCLVEVDDAFVSRLVLPDPDDRHVLAVALQCKARVIVTFNLKDFPNNTLSVYGIEARHPDQFVDDLFDHDPAAVIEAAVKQRASLRKPLMSTETYLECLLRQGMTQTVKNLSGFRSLL